MSSTVNFQVSIKTWHTSVLLIVPSILYMYISNEPKSNYRKLFIIFLLYITMKNTSQRKGCVQTSKYMIMMQCKKNHYYYQRIMYTMTNWISKFWGIYNDWKKFVKIRTQCSGLHKTMEIHQYWEGNGCSGRWEVLVEAESTVIQWGAPSSPERHRLWSRWPHPVCSVSSGKTMQPFHLTLTSPLLNSYQWDESWIP